MLRPGRAQAEPGPGAVIGPGLAGHGHRGAVTRTVADAAAVLDVISVPIPTLVRTPRGPIDPFAEEVGADPGPLRVALCTVSALGLPVGDGPVGGGGARRPAPRGGGPQGRRVTGCRRVRPVGPGPVPHVVNAGLGEMTDIDWERVEPHNRAAHDRWPDGGQSDVRPIAGRAPPDGPPDRVPVRRPSSTFWSHRP